MTLYRHGDRVADRRVDRGICLSVFKGHPDAAGRGLKSWQYIVASPPTPSSCPTPHTPDPFPGRQASCNSVVCTVWCALCGVHSVVGTVWWVQCGMHSVVCTVWWVQCGGHSVRVMGTVWWAAEMAALALGSAATSAGQDLSVHMWHSSQALRDA